jgi:hypothetical protein
MAFKNDILGNMFGRLTAIERRDSKRGYANYLCRCSCGQSVEVNSHDLRSGNTQSCGCFKRDRLSSRLHDVIGVTFGKLTVLARVSSVGEPAVKYLCECVCGNRTEVFRGNLGGTGVQNTESCGCLHRERTAKAKRLRPYEALYNHLQTAAVKRNFSVHISYEDFLVYTKQKECHYCADTVIWAMYNGNNKGYNLDRKDSTLGYLKPNVVVCCGQCNRGKGNRYTYEEWVCMTAALKVLRNKKSFSIARGA